MLCIWWLCLKFLRCSVRFAQSRDCVMYVVSPTLYCGMSPAIPKRTIEDKSSDSYAGDQKKRQDIVKLSSHV